MTERKRPSHSEDELLEQWDFLDAMVDRQAAQLRSGIQDSEEVDEPVAIAGGEVVPKAELDALDERLAALRREHDALRREHEALKAERTELAARLAAAPPPPAVTADEHARLRSEHEALRAQHRAASDELQRLRTEVEALRSAPVPASPDPNSGAEVEAARRRLAEVEAELSREQARRGELVESLRVAHGELESLRQQQTRRSWWRR